VGGVAFEQEAWAMLETRTVTALLGAGSAGLTARAWTLASS
jgi:hypothetical protein